MGVAAILVMRSRCHKKNFVPPIQGGFTYNLALIGLAVSEKKMLEHCERRRRKMTGSGGLISLPVVYCRRFKDGSSFVVCSVARFQLIFGTVFLVLFERRYEKTGLRGFRPGLPQTGLYSHRRRLEA